ncbi:hypothetical protein Tco_0708314 [Tanacetum coccineum]
MSLPCSKNSKKCTKKGDFRLDFRSRRKEAFTLAQAAINSFPTLVALPEELIMYLSRVWGQLAAGATDR